MTLGRRAINLGGAPVAANDGIVWQFTTGTAPYVTTMSVHEKDWDQKLKRFVGRPLTLSIGSPGTGRGSITIRDVYIIHAVPSSSPYRVSFLVADKRYWWQRTLVARAYNVKRKSGDREIRGNRIPRATEITVDLFDYVSWSLKNGKEKWTAEDAVKDVLEQLDKDTGKKKANKMAKANFVVESFPIDPKTGEGAFSLQDVILRDRGDVALARLLSYIPGAEVTVGADGKVRVFDGADVMAGLQKAEKLPPSAYTGDVPTFIKREKIRPGQIDVYYEREVECLFEYDDNYGPTSSVPVRDRPYLDNVIPTVDDKTTVTEYDPISDKTITRKDLPPGTWVTFKAWLSAMNDARPTDSQGNTVGNPWTFKTLSYYWIAGNLDAVLGNKPGEDTLATANVSARVEAIKQHFRQTFRINPRYMERIKSVRPVRAAVIDPATGKRAIASVWPQGCIVPSGKGLFISQKLNRPWAYVNVNHLRPLGTGEADNIFEVPPAPMHVNMLDEDLGIFRLEYVLSPYGTEGAFIPSMLCNLKNAGNTSVSQNLADQTKYPMGPGMVIEGGANGIRLDPSMSLKVMLTIVPGAPNNTKQFHRISVTSDDLLDTFRTSRGFEAGEGPPMAVWTPPGEATARFMWTIDNDCVDTMKLLLGLNSDNPNEAGLPEDDPKTKDKDESKMAGFQLVNGDRELAGHSKAYAVEVYSQFQDNVAGGVATGMPDNGKIELTGNIVLAAIRVAGYPSAKVDVVWQFRGRQAPISRFAFLPEDVRRLILGIIPFKG